MYLTCCQILLLGADFYLDQHWLHFQINMNSLKLPCQVFLFVPFVAKVWRRWKEKGWTEAQRKRPEQQHQLTGSSLLIRVRRLLNCPLAPRIPPSLLSLHQVSSFHITMKDIDVLEQDTLLAFLYQALCFLF